MPLLPVVDGDIRTKRSCVPQPQSNIYAFGDAYNEYNCPPNSMKLSACSTPEVRQWWMTCHQDNPWSAALA